MRSFLFLLLLALLPLTGFSQTINFPDANFKNKLLQASPSNYIARSTQGNYVSIDTNQNGEIEVSEALAIEELDVSNVGSNNAVKISNLTGINNFDNLLEFYCYENLLTSLDVTSFTNLTTVGCDLNQITTFNVSGLNNLTYISCAFNNIATLDLQDKSVLKTLYCNQNNISSLDLSDLSSLEYLTVSNNPVTEIDMGNNPYLTDVQCMFTNITTLDVSGQHYLNLLMCGHCPLLETILMKNGSNEQGLNFEQLPNLRYICDDESHLGVIQGHINVNGYNCTANSYCSFVPGGQFYTIQGDNRYDFLNNGCDAGDSAYPNMKFTISGNTSGTATQICGPGGSYAMPVQAGTVTLTPVIENTAYFTATPASVTISIPEGNNSPAYQQDFCVVPNGQHSDLEVVLLPISVARPGFNATYVLVCRNKGNQAQSPMVSFTFDDAVLDFIHAAPAASSTSTGLLGWNLPDLLPFETRQIIITLNLNSPVETPALNSGDILNLSAAINGTTDETPLDNVAYHDQHVVNSLDPNDKTCIEGEAIALDKVGDYIHYIIRFENTGTYPAENVVVRDDINMSKFDISSLLPLSSSHNYTTRITNNNRVEFIFENINLPFEDNANDGYIAFKIKTKPTLQVGDSFSNTASIYFDYNAPVITNTYTTTIQVLKSGTPIFKEDKIMVSPNPFKDFINISAEDNMKSVEIIDLSGKLIISTDGGSKKIDTAHLPKGVYIMKVKTDTSSSVHKIIK